MRILVFSVYFYDFTSLDLKRKKCKSTGDSIQTYLAILTNEKNYDDILSLQNVCYLLSNRKISF